MKSIIYKMAAILVLLVITTKGFGQEQSAIPVNEMPEEYGFIIKIGDTIPDFALNLINGKTVFSRDWRGKVVMLQFNASWSGICRKLIPFIENEIWTKYRKNRNFVLYGIDRGEPLETVKTFIKEMDINYPFAVDPQADIFGLFAKKDAGVTRNIIINKEGKVVFVTRLYKDEEFRQMGMVIDHLLKGK